MFSAPRKELNRFDFSLRKITARYDQEFSPSESERAERKWKRGSARNSISRGNSAPFYSTPNCFRRAFKRSLFEFISRSYRTIAPNVYIQDVLFRDSKFFIEFGIEFSLERVFSQRDLFLFLFVTKDGNIRIPLSSISHSFPIISTHFSLFSLIFLSSCFPFFSHRLLLFFSSSFFFSSTCLIFFFCIFSRCSLFLPFSLLLSSRLLSTRFQRAFIWIYFALI